MRSKKKNYLHYIKTTFFFSILLICLKGLPVSRVNTKQIVCAEIY